MELIFSYLWIFFEKKSKKFQKYWLFFVLPVDTINQSSIIKGNY